MSIGTIKPLVTAEDVQGLPNAELQLVARAALAAGYTVDVRHIRYEYMVFANGKHFHPLTNWMQCVRLVVDTKQQFEISGGGGSVLIQDTKDYELRKPTTDQEYYQQMCEAVVTNTAKGFPV
jgi:hypothetical protein